MRKQPNNIKDLLSIEKKTQDMKESIDDIDFQNKYQEQLETEALDLSPGEISDQQNGKQGSASAVNRYKKNQMIKYMQMECERLIKMMHKHDPIKDMEFKLQKLKPKDSDDSSSDNDISLEEISVPKEEPRCPISEFMDKYRAS